MNVLAVGSHPDDVEYGCGGYLATMAKEHEVWMFVATLGERGGDPTVRFQELGMAALALGGLGLMGGPGWKDTALPSDAELVGTLEEAIQVRGADVVLVNTADDTHQDHRRIAQATLAAARRVPRVLCYHAPSSTRVFTRVVCADISNKIETKCLALDAHASQARHRLSELARAEAIFWGGRAGVPFAEAFEPVRWLL